MSGFTRHRLSGAIIATFSGFEADLLRNLAGQLVELLRNERAVPQSPKDPLEELVNSAFDSMTGGFDGPVSEPEDPVLQRLFPNAYRDDDEAAADFRRYTESALRDGKAAGAVAIIDGLEEAGLPALLEEEGLVIDVELDEPAAMAWLKSFTDLRLALATRLGVEEGDEDRWAALPDDDPQAQAHDIYEWVGYLQETLVHALAS